MSINQIAFDNAAKTALFRALQLGDMLCAIPAVRAFKKRYPDSAVTLIGLPWAEDFVKRFPGYFSSFIPFPGYPGLVEQPYDSAEFEEFVSRFNKEKFDLLVQMHGNGSITNGIMARLDARVKAGYFKKGDEPLNRDLYMPYPESVHEVKRHLMLMNFLGVPGDGNALEFPVTETERSSAAGLCDYHALSPRGYACIHPGARDERRRWAPENFARVADMLVNGGFRVVLTGTASEAEVAGAVQRSMRHPVVNLAGKTELGVLAALIRNSGILVCNDTGVSHIAAAVGVPSVVIFLASDPKRWAPLDFGLHESIHSDRAGDIEGVLSAIKRRLPDKRVNGNSLRVA